MEEAAEALEAQEEEVRPLQEDEGCCSSGVMVPEGEEDTLEPGTLSTRNRTEQKRNRVKMAVACCMCFIALAFPITLAVALMEEDSSPAPTTPAPPSLHAVVASPYDPRSYRPVQLSSGLRFLLVSDPTTTKAAAACDIDGGSVSDPPDWPGLAHFNEHMLFLGTHKHPEETAFSDVLKAHGGRDNAYTFIDHVTFFFSVLPEGLDPVVDLWAGFFQDPLFNQGAISRELVAVDNEFSRDLTMNVWRRQRLQRHLSNPDSPYHKFSTGSLESLNKTGLRDALVNFFDETFRPNKMAFAVVGPQSLDELEAIVSERFSGFSARPGAPLPWRADPQAVPQPFPPRLLGVVAKALPAPGSATRNVVIWWPFDFSVQNTTTRPFLVMEYLFAHEGEGSLAHVLQDAGYATRIGAGLWDELGWFTTFGVTVDLTEKGEANIDAVISTIYAYVEKMKREGAGLKDWWDAARKAQEFAWTLPEVSDPSKFVVELSASFRVRMDQGTPELVLGPPSEYVWDPDRVTHLLDSFSVQNSLTILTLPSNSDADQIEPWYGIKYSVSPADPTRWSGTDGVPPHLGLPGRDPMFLVEVAEAEAPFKGATAKGALWVASPAGFPSLEMWRKPAVGKLPLSGFRVRMWTGWGGGDVPSQHYVSARLAETAVRLQLSAVGYSAEMAALSWQVTVTPFFLEVRTSGVHPKQPLLLGKLLQGLATEVDTGAFEKAVAVTKQELEDVSETVLYRHAYSYLRSEITDEPTREELLANLPTATSRAVATVLLRRKIGSCSAALVGSFVDPEAETERFLSSFATDDICKSSDPLPPKAGGITQLGPRSWSVLRAPSPDPGSPNDAVVSATQLCPDSDVVCSARAIFLGKLLAPAFFHQLRTVEKLGYIASASVVVLRRVVHLVCTVQGNNHTAAVLDARVENFLAGVNFSEYDFPTVRSALVEELGRSPQTLEEDLDWLWDAAVNVTDRGTSLGSRTWSTDRRVHLAAVVNATTTAELQSWYDTVVLAKRRRISVQVFHNPPPYPAVDPSDHPKASPPTPRYISERGELRKEYPLWF